MALERRMRRFVCGRVCGLAVLIFGVGDVRLGQELNVRACTDLQSTVVTRSKPRTTPRGPAVDFSTRPTQRGRSARRRVRAGLNLRDVHMTGRETGVTDLVMGIAPRASGRPQAYRRARPEAGKTTTI